MANQLYFPAYFKDWDAIRDAVSHEQGWALFLACLDYAENGVELESDDPVITAFFKLLSGGINRSIEASERRAQKNRYNRYRGVCAQKGIVPLEFEDWVVKIDNTQHSSIEMNDCQPSLMNADNRDNHNHYAIDTQSERNPVEIQSVDKSKDAESAFENRRNLALDLLDNYIGG